MWTPFHATPVGEAPTEGVGETEVQVARIRLHSKSNSPPTISNLLSVSPDFTHSKEPFRGEQLKDLDLADMIHFLDHPASLEHYRRIVLKSRMFSVVNGVLHIAHRGGSVCVVVPQHLHRRLMDEYHTRRGCINTQECPAEVLDEV